MGKITPRLGGGGNRPGVAVRVSDLPVFQREKVEELVLEDRVAQRAAQHVLPLRVEGVGGAVGGGIEPRIPSQVERAAVPVVGAGSGGHGNQAAGAMAG